jgi:hypothetical protein
LSAVATANSASNSVQLGDAETATVAASGVTVNYQSTSAEGSISAEIGIAGTEAIAGFTSLNGATTPSTASDIDYASGTGTLTVTVNPVTVVFDSALTAEEALVLTNLGWTASSGSATVVIPVGTYNITGSLSSISVNDPSPGGGADTDETITIAGFNAAPVAGTLNGAGVLVRVDANDEGSITDSQVSVSDNTVVGEVNGNTAVNATFATATSIEGLGTTATSVNVEDTTTADPTGADLATTNVQASAAALSSDVDAVFGIVAEDGNGGTVARSSQTVSENLQQSYATANRATNSVDLTATNSDADTALDSIQSSNASVATTSDMEVLAEAASDTSSLALDGNTNLSFANVNVFGNAVTVDVTNASDGTAGGDNAGYTDPSDMVVTANNVLSSAQTVIASVTASAESDIYNQDATSTEGDPISDGDISLSGNATIAQATANSAASGNTMTLGDAGTANMDQTGFVYNFQSVQATALVTASVDQDVSVTLSNDGSVPVNSSSLSLDGNGTTALARSNVATNSLIVDGANIDAGDGTDADLNDIAAPSLDAAYVLFSLQENAGDVTATTTQSRVEVVLSDAGAGTTGARSGGGVLDSALSLSGNTSSATALANNVVNAVTIGANAANVDATAALDNNQVTTSAGPVLATGGSAVRVDVTVTGGSDPLGISGSTVMLSGNSSVSNATGNQSQNTLTASGANITSGGGDRAIVNSAVDATLNADAGNLLTNTQTNNATITSTNTANVVDISSDTAAGTVTPGSAVSGSTLAVMNNVTEARASANLSLNSSISIGGAGTASLDSTGMVGNFQTNDANATVSASASTATTIGLTAGADATALNGGTAMLTGNSTLALARGNVAENNVVADGANVTSGISPVSLNASTGPLTAALYASYGVFNEQQQLAAINAESQNTSYRVDLTGGTRTSGALGLALNAGSATVSGNSIDATSYGNIAINSVTLSSLSIAANDASAAVFNGQNNGGAIGATVSGATIGAYTTGGITNGSIGVSNNAINATSVGNFATSTVTRTDR